MRDFLLDTQTIRYWYDEDCPQHAAVIDNIESWKEQARLLEHKPKLLVSGTKGRPVPSQSGHAGIAMRAKVFFSRVQMRCLQCSRKRCRTTAPG